MAACSHTQHPAPAPNPGGSADGDTSIVVSRLTFSPQDTSLLAAIALSIADSARGIEVRLDPRPLPPGIDSPDAMPRNADMAGDARAGLAKVGGIVEARIREPDIRRERHACGSRTPCPKRRYVQVVLGTPRPGIPVRRKVDAPLEAKPTYWTTRAIVSTREPGGGWTQLEEYLFDKTPSGWVFVKRVALFVID